MKYVGTSAPLYSIPKGKRPIAEPRNEEFPGPDHYDISPKKIRKPVEPKEKKLIIKTESNRKNPLLDLENITLVILLKLVNAGFISNQKKAKVNNFKNFL